ncbi:MAG: ATP-binding protein [Candidatus Bathyarchaeia archaeon]
MVKISEIVNQNPWWKHGEKFAAFDKNLKEANEKPIFFERKRIDLDKGNIYVLRGPRQVGKTTYMKDLIDKLINAGIDPNHILYLSSDFFISRRELRNAIAYFMNKNIDVTDLHIFIDEITSIKDWNLELKYLSDSGTLEKARILATGSCASALRRKGELLPRRRLEGNEYYMKPLSFRDFVLQITDQVISMIEEAEFRDSLKKLLSTLEKTGYGLEAGFSQLFKALHQIAPFKRELDYLFNLYMRYGGYPFVVNDYLLKKLQSEQRQSSFSINPKLSEALMRDIIGDIAKLGKQETFVRQILKEISDKYGSRYSFSKLASDIETTHVTTIDYLETLEESFILTVLYAFDFNKKDIKFKGEKKIFFQDPFIFHSIKSFLTGKDINEIIDETLQNEELVGKLVEGIVASHLIANQEIPMMREPKTFLWFYYDTRGKGIDSIIRINEKYTAIETKYQSSVSSKDIWRIPQVKEYAILTKEDLKTEDNIFFAPVDLTLAVLKKSHQTL